MVSKNRSIISGYVSILTVIEYPPSIMYASKILYPEKRDYHLAIKWQTLLRKAGHPLPAVDLIIASQAYKRGLTHVTRDNHFGILREKVVPDLKTEIRG